MSILLKNLKKIDEAFKPIDNLFNEVKDKNKVREFCIINYELVRLIKDTVLINNTNLINEPLFYNRWLANNYELALSFNKNCCNRGAIYNLVETVNKIDSYYCYTETRHGKNFKEDSLMVLTVIVGFKPCNGDLNIYKSFNGRERAVKMFTAKMKHKKTLKVRELKVKKIDEKRELKANKPKKPAKIRFIPKIRPIKLGFDGIRDYNPCIPKEKPYNPEFDGYGVYDPRFEQIDTVETYDGNFDWDKYYESVV